jgi:hypothetical protein
MRGDVEPAIFCRLIRRIVDEQGIWQGTLVVYVSDALITSTAVVLREDQD